jgi:hypothetical protein
MNQNKLLILIVLILLAPSLIYINMTSVQSYGEYFIPNQQGIPSLFSTWQQTNYGTNNSASLWRIFPLTAFYELFNSVLHIPPSVTQGIFLFGLRLIGFFSFIALVKVIYKKRLSNKALLLAGLIFVFNLYTLNYYASSYIILLPYYLLPLQLLLLAKALYSAKIRNTVLFCLGLAFVNAATFGVNLVYDVIAFAALTILSILLLIKKETTLKKTVVALVIATGATLILVAWWILPMLLSSTSDKETSNYILNSEDFYSLETSPLNLMRGLGEWGFFSGSKGEPYHNFASWYLSPLALISSLLLIVTTVASLAFAKESKPKRIKQLMVSLTVIVLLMLPFVGGTNGKDNELGFF